MKQKALCSFWSICSFWRAIICRKNKKQQTQALTKCSSNLEMVLQNNRPNSYTLFYECHLISQLWNWFRFSDKEDFNFPLTPQGAVFELTDLTDNFHLINHLWPIFKFCVYKARKKNHVNILQLKSAIHKIKEVSLI